MRLRWAAFTSVAAVMLLLGSCGGNNKPMPNATPIIAGLFPDHGTAGGPNFTLFISGTGFMSSSTVQWNGSTLSNPAFSRDTTQISVTIPAANVASPGIAQVTVINPAPGGGPSFAATFTIDSQNPVPNIASLSPSSTAVGVLPPNGVLTVNGTNFLSTSVVAFNGASRAATFKGPTQLAITLTAPDVAAAGTISVTVTNPPPGGGKSPASVFTIGPASALQKQFPQVLSVNAFGGPADGPSGAPAISADGRFVAFYSQAKNLVAQGASGNIFVRDTCLDGADCAPQTIAVDLAPDGSAPNGPAEGPVSISLDGRFVAFSSFATNLVADGPASGAAEFTSVFVRDTCLGPDAPSGCVPHTTEISLDPMGHPANAASVSPSLSGDGRFVAFASAAGNLAPGSSPGGGIFVRDTCVGPAAPQSCTPRTFPAPMENGTELQRHARREVVISADGRYVVFNANVGGVVSSSGIALPQILLADMCLGPAAPAGCVPSTTKISISPDGSFADGANEGPSVSADGRFVVFQSQASNLISGQSGGPQNAFLRDTCLGPAAPDGCVPATALISSGLTGALASHGGSSPWMNSAGRYVSFIAGASNGSETGAPAMGWLYVYDTCFGATNPCTPQAYPVTALGAGREGSPLSVDASTPVPLTSDGRFAAFFAPNTASASPLSGFGDVFLTVTPF